MRAGPPGPFCDHRISVNPKPFQFLADVRQPMRVGELREQARRAEAVGYHALVIPDHLLDQFSPVPAMAAVAAVSDRLRIGAFVFNNDLRHPAVLAQDLASLDVLSDGRLDINIGAGWNRAEYEALGIAFDPAPVRSERLAEAIAVLKGCMGPGPFSFDGSHYRIREHDGGPKPVQRPHPSFMIGGGGRRTLELAAREADVVGLAPRIRAGRGDPLSFTWEATQEKIAWVRAAAGERWERLTLNVYPSTVPVTITDAARTEARKAADTLTSRFGAELTEAQVLASPHVFIGSLASLTEKLIDLRERLGISSFMLGEPGPLDPLVERLSGS
jgi:probable F420-dependent oxidoreductase